MAVAPWELPLQWGEPGPLWTPSMDAAVPPLLLQPVPPFPATASSNARAGKCPGAKNTLTFGFPCTCEELVNRSRSNWKCQGAPGLDAWLCSCPLPWRSRVVGGAKGQSLPFGEARQAGRVSRAAVLSVAWGKMAPR